MLEQIEINTVGETALPIPAPPAQQMRVLIVEDDATTALLLERTLTAAGYEVTGKANDGEAGIEQARSTRPDLILMDSNMPGMNGIEATRQIMAERPIPIIMLTGYSEGEHVDAAIDAGACTYLVKPVVGSRLLPSIKTAIDIFGMRYA